MAFSWKLYGDGKTPPLGEAVAPDERLSWPLTVGIGAQHVVAMFGATFVFPLIMGLDANLAIMMSGVATIIFLLIVKGQVPSYLGTSAAFVGGVLAVRAQSDSDAAVLGAILVSGVVLALAGVFIHFVGPRAINAALPPAVTGAVVMLIGFNLAPVVAGVYWPQDQWVGLATMTFVIIASLLLRGFWARISILLGLIFGYLLSVLLDVTTGQITSFDPNTGEETTRDRINFDAVGQADWIGLPEFTTPTFSVNFSLLVLPAVIALIAENAGHVKAVAAMTKRDLDPVMGRAVFADGVATVVATSVGGSPPRRTPRTSASWPPRASTPPRPTTWPRSWRSCWAWCPSSAR
ncbi:solute carrier family 23 protein [Blastococcus brunescens]|uniref:Solute carrier family 23 protein n=1 Tax=Blastococcus brunescens TaxID=1564165 RepID=A0ABZ1B3Q1_9ACTN|nr:solute carrier family 23 protein [Blastococcus sp. BMG 8361]WRL63979.1 solute carrier family 23 protein [Blastococcus sp. BMG 8361]